MANLPSLPLIHLRPTLAYHHTSWVETVRGWSPTLRHNEAAMAKDTSVCGY